MKCTIPEISWHNRDPVLSIDIQNGNIIGPNNEVSWRLATGGADSHVLIWHLTINEVGAAVITCVADLTRHQKAVNTVRFSPSADILASGDDESAIILWKQREESELPPLTNDETQNKEQWTSWKVLRGHMQDVYDVSWSPDSNFLVSGSVDNTAILWDVQKGRSISILSDYKGFVQGVSWDPCNQYICTISTDRQCRLIDVNTKKTIQRVHKAKIPTPNGSSLEGKMVRLFHDDTFKSFFRRLTFTIDGSLIIVPSGIIEPQDSTERSLNATVVFSRYNLKEPIAILPSLKESTIAVRCCPLFFQLREDGPTSMIALPYRMVFAVATQHSVLIYDTQQTSPVATISNIHYTRLTDLAWSSDGKMLVVSSTDGYCSIINFHEGELGKTIEREVLPMNKSITAANKSSVLNKQNDSKINQTQNVLLELDNNAMDIDIASIKSIESINGKEEHKEIEEKKEISKTEINVKPIQTSLKDNNCHNDIEETEDIRLIYSDDSNTEIIKEKSKSTPSKLEIELENNKNTPPKVEKPPVLTAKTPRRVQLITLSSPKRTKKD
ncbi:chromatin assembly factor 1 subunit B [Orussus abietinus]|uniref:chromatin assembly factor 1 subunit B n=1 Tax=Orussus abietinus TaxID=222816 RepID=UPI000625F284|nr:chromatin assembly factor 1 subunit B [Orussus abietinus]